MDSDGPDAGQLTHRNPVAQQGYTQLPNCLIFCKTLSAQALRLYTMLKHYAWKSGAAWPGQMTLATDMGLKPRMVQTYLTELKDHHLLTVERRGFTQTNRYVIEDPDLEWLDSLCATYCVSDAQSTAHHEAQPIADQDAQPIAHKEDRNVKKTKAKESDPPALPDLATGDISPPNSNGHNPLGLIRVTCRECGSARAHVVKDTGFGSFWMVQCPACKTTYGPVPDPTAPVTQSKGARPVAAEEPPPVVVKVPPGTPVNRRPDAPAVRAVPKPEPSSQLLPKWEPPPDFAEWYAEACAARKRQPTSIDLIAELQKFRVHPSTRKLASGEWGAHWQLWILRAFDGMGQPRASSPASAPPAPPTRYKTRKEL